MAETFQIIRNCWQTANDGGMFYYLFEVAILYFLIKDRKPFREMTVYCLGLFILVMNPLTGALLMNTAFGNNYQYVFYLYPMIPICAYIAIDWLKDQKERYYFLVTILSIGVLIGVSSYLYKNNEDIKEKTTDYYLDEEYLQIVSQISTEGGTFTRLLANDDIMLTARAYNKQIGLLYEVPIMYDIGRAMAMYDDNIRNLHQQIQDPEFALGNITSSSQKYRCNYLVLPLEFDQRGDMENLGYQCVIETENFVLYRISL